SVVETAALADAVDAARAANLLTALGRLLADDDRAALLRWCVEHAHDHDPLPAAWAGCASGPVLRLFVRRAFGRDAHAAAREVWQRAYDEAWRRKAWPSQAARAATE